MSNKRLSSSEEDVNQRLQILNSRLTKLNLVEVRLKKLNFALGSIALSEKPRQLSMIRAAHRHVGLIESGEVHGLKLTLSRIRNELDSFHDGIRTGEVTPADLVLTSGVQALQSVTDVQNKIKNIIGRLQIQLQAEEIDQNELIILRNKKYKERMPSLSNSNNEFAIARAPVAFTFQGKEKHSSVGYVPLQNLDLMGFKVENLGGYTILHNQLVVGINTKALHTQAEDKDGEPVVDAEGNAVKVPRTVKESNITFKAGKPTKVHRMRPITLRELADKVVKQMEKKTKVPYGFVSDKPVGHNGAGWFWVMPAADLIRLAKAFPAHHITIFKWGFAF